MAKINHILHIDMDCFYAQVEEKRHPEYAGKPLAVGGIENGHGVLCTSNYIAREFGVRAAMPTSKALKLCPELVLIKPTMHIYREISIKVFNIFNRYTSMIQPVSLDEAYLDLSTSPHFKNNPIQIALEIKKSILEETGLTASIGISYNKFLAKFASDLLKPNGMTVIGDDKIIPFLAQFNVDRINGVGKVMQHKMKNHGIYTIGDIQKRTKLDLVNLFGKFGVDLYNYSRGIDNRAVNADLTRKSISTEHTFYNNLSSKSDLNSAIENVFNELCLRLEKKGIENIKSIFVKIKYSDFKSVSIEKKCLLNLVNIKKLFWEKFNLTMPVRLIGIGIKLYDDDQSDQLRLI